MKRKLYEFKDVHPWDSYEESTPGTVEWAARVSKSLQIHSEDRSSAAGIYLPKTIKAILKAKPAPWEVYPPGNPFGTPDVYSEAVTGHSWEALLALVADLDPSDRRMMLAALAEAQAKTRPQGKHSPHEYNVPMKKGNSSEATLRKLAQHAPEVLARYEAGEFKSVAAAARAAGIKVGQSPLQKLRSAWKSASQKEREIFASEILKAQSIFENLRDHNDQRRIP